MALERTETLHGKLKKIVESVGNLLVDGFHYLALFAIGGAIVWSAGFAFVEMVNDGHVTIQDILLLFIYLELLAMVGIYFKTNHMPVRFLIYIAVTALTRMLIGDVQVSHEFDERLLYISGAILILAIANLVIRYSSHKYPYGSASDDGDVLNQ